MFQNGFGNPLARARRPPIGAGTVGEGAMGLTWIIVFGIVACILFLIIPSYLVRPGTTGGAPVTMPISSYYSLNFFGGSGLQVQFPSTSTESDANANTINDATTSGKCPRGSSAVPSAADMVVPACASDVQPASVSLNNGTSCSTLFEGRNLSSCASSKTWAVSVVPPASTSYQSQVSPTTTVNTEFTINVVQSTAQGSYATVDGTLSILNTGGSSATITSIVVMLEQVVSKGDQPVVSGAAAKPAVLFPGTSSADLLLAMASFKSPSSSACANIPVCLGTQGNACVQVLTPPLATANTLTLPLANNGVVIPPNADACTTVPVRANLYISDAIRAALGNAKANQRFRFTVAVTFTTGCPEQPACAIDVDCNGSFDSVRTAVARSGQFSLAGSPLFSSTSACPSLCNAVRLQGSRQSLSIASCRNGVQGVTVSSIPEQVLTSSTSIAASASVTCTEGCECDSPNIFDAEASPSVAAFLVPAAGEQCTINGQSLITVASSSAELQDAAPIVCQAPAPVDCVYTINTVTSACTESAVSGTCSQTSTSTATVTSPACYGGGCSPVVPAPVTRACNPYADSCGPLEVVQSPCFCYSPSPSSSEPSLGTGAFIADLSYGNCADAACSNALSSDLAAGCLQCAQSVQSELPARLCTFSQDLWQFCANPASTDLNNIYRTGVACDFYSSSIGGTAAPQDSSAFSLEAFAMNLNRMYFSWRGASVEFDHDPASCYPSIEQASSNNPYAAAIRASLPYMNGLTYSEITAVVASLGEPTSCDFSTGDLRPAVQSACISIRTTLNTVLTQFIGIMDSSLSLFHRRAALAFFMREVMNEGLLQDCIVNADELTAANRCWKSPVTVPVPSSTISPPPPPPPTISPPPPPPPAPMPTPTPAPMPPPPPPPPPAPVQTPSGCPPNLCVQEQGVCSNIDAVCINSGNCARECVEGLCTLLAEECTTNSDCSQGTCQDSTGMEIDNQFTCTRTGGSCFFFTGSGPNGNCPQTC